MFSVLMTSGLSIKNYGGRPTEAVSNRLTLRLLSKEKYVGESQPITDNELLIREPYPAGMTIRE